MRLLSFLIALFIAIPSYATEEFLRLDTRPDVKVPILYIKNIGAQATVLLLSGGRGGMGKIIDGQPTSANFLVRSRNYFADNGLNVAVMGLPSDKKAGYIEPRLSISHFS